MVQISRKALAQLAFGWGVADFFAGGRLGRPIGDAARKAVVKAAPAIARGIIRYGPTAALTAARVTPTPLAAAVTGAAVVANRELIRDAAGNVYEKVAPAAQQYAAGVAERALDPETYTQRREGPTMASDMLIERLVGKPKKQRSKFNSAVSKGMKIVKGSTSYGKKGTINNAKKAFTAVTKAASAVSKGRKAPKSGIRRKLHTAMSKILPKKKKTTKKKNKIDIKVYRS